MSNFAVLKIVHLFKPLFIKLGIDYGQMRQILALKLTMDSRRGNAGLQGANNGNSKNKQLMALFSYVVMGIFVALFAAIIGDLYLKASIFISFVLVLMTLTMVSDFSNVLLDVKEKLILHTKPIDPKAISTAKVIHILNYMVMYTLALMLPSLVIMTIKYGLLVLLMLILALILVDFLVVFITSILYVLILKTFDGEKLKDIINFFQISLGILVMVGYQLFNNTIALKGFDLHIEPVWYHVFLPQMWYAAWFMDEHTVLLNGLRILSVVLPICMFLFYTKVLSKKFEMYISKLEESGEKVNHKKAARKRKQLDNLSKIVTRSPKEAASFKLGMTMLGKDRKLKVMMLPTMALGAVLPVIIAVRFLLQDVASTNIYLWMYMSVGMLGVFVIYITYSENYKGAWVFEALPIKDYKEIQKGIQKAYVFKYVIKFMLIPIVAFLIISGIKAIPHFIVVLLLMLIITRICGLTINNEQPFSRELKTVNEEKSKLIGLNFGIFTLSGILAGVHYLASLHWIALTVLGVIYFAICMGLWMKD